MLGFVLMRIRWWSGKQTPGTVQLNRQDWAADVAMVGKREA